MRPWTILLLCSTGAGSLGAQEWIRDVKMAPDRFLGEEVRLEGVVAGTRATGGGVRGGSFFLVDASDLAGIRVETNDLPKEGARIALTGLVQTGSGPSSPVTLIEVGRRGIGPTPIMYLLVAVSVVLTLFLLLAYLRTSRRERDHRLATPIWLIPGPGRGGGGGGGGGGEKVRVPATLDPARAALDLEIATRLRHRKRAVFLVMSTMAVASSASGGWLAFAQMSIPQRTFVFQPMDRGPDRPRPALADSGLVDTVPLAQGNLRDRPGGRRTDPGSNAAPSQRTPPAPTPTLPTRDTGTSSGRSVPDTVTPSDTVVPSPAVADTAPREQASTPPPAPPPVPILPPVDSAALRAARAERLREAADRQLNDLGRQLLEAVNGGDRSRVAALWPQGLGDQSIRKRFLDFVGDFDPAATLGGLESPAILEDSASSSATLSLTWRGNFGVSRKATATFALRLQRQGDRWVSTGIHLTSRFP